MKKVEINVIYFEYTNKYTYIIAIIKAKDFFKHIFFVEKIKLWYCYNNYAKMKRPYIIIDNELRIIPILSIKNFIKKIVHINL